MILTQQSPLVPKLDINTYQMLIGGDFVDGSEGDFIERASPAQGVVVSRYAKANATDAERAILSARRAFDTGPWPRMKGAERSRILFRAADMIEARLEEMARLDTLESGKPIAQARGEMAGAVDIWRYAASLARNVHGESYDNLGEQTFGAVVRDPIGVVSIITPWNFPFLIVSQKLPFALAAGCTAVVKPSELTSASTLLLGKILMDAELPAGVVNILAGTGMEVGAPMVTHPLVDMISFTGSTRVGKWAMAAASETLKKVSLELGGKNPQIVFPDADIDAAADAIVFGAFFNTGQCCNAGSRLLVHDEIAADLMAEVSARASTIVVGDPLDEMTKVGAIITAEHLGKIEEYISQGQAAGANVRLGGKRITKGSGHFLAPTIIDGVKPGMAVARDEIFGPVLSVLTFKSNEQAIALANDADYGLSASVWSRDFDTCMSVARRVRAGTVWINTFMDGFPELPFGGYRQSGLGRELGRHAVEDYTETKTLTMHIGPRTGWWLPRA
jgi:acyl-CoA reductase-like NAD-dependent aldehyde dehydrogenase